MEKSITIVYANRDRSLARIKSSLESLAKQTSKDFKVVFVDYGSAPLLQDELMKLSKDFSFMDYYPLKVRQLLWNKSKALNYGILQCKTSFLFIADVDHIFHPTWIENLKQIANPAQFFLFELGYLSQKESLKINKEYKFDDLSVSNFGKVNGMILAPKKAYVDVNGFDEFFHFYGGEDVDLFARMENAGFKKQNFAKKLVYHNWHQSFSGSEDKMITRNPRMKNIMRLNQRHFLSNKRLGRIRPLRQLEIGENNYSKEVEKLKNPDHKYSILNMQAHVEHFLNEELRSVTGVVQAKFEIDPYYQSNKYQIKKLAGKQTQPYISLKEVNDLLLKKIVFDFRDSNYSFEISEDLNNIDLRIEL